MRFFASWLFAAWAVPHPSPQFSEVNQQQQKPQAAFVVDASRKRIQTRPIAPSSSLTDGVSLWIAQSTAQPPSNDDIQLLRQAFAEFYGVERNIPKSLDLLSQTIDRWQGQPADELAGLYRVRGDAHMLATKAAEAMQDYTQAITLLKSPGGAAADPAEAPAALLGRARAIKSRKSSSSQKDLKQAASDYREALILTSREEWDTEDELLEDGASRNPYAAWEWGSVCRLIGDYQGAARAHKLAATAFDDIGDRARSVISLLDAGIDMAGAASSDKDDDAAKTILKEAMSKTKGVEGGDVKLLQRVIAKEGEGSMALAAILWDEGRRDEAENILGNVCLRLDQLEAYRAKRGSDGQGTIDQELEAPQLRFSIDDDYPPVSSISCTRFRDVEFVADSLGWPENLSKKVVRLEKLQVV